MNIELLQRVRDFIAKHPRHFNLGHFASSKNSDVEDWTLGDCGTTACIAGTAVLLANGGNVAKLRHTQWHNTGRSILGLTESEAQSLFYAERGSVWLNHADEFGWEVDLGEVVYWDCVTAEQAVVILDRIISGEVKL